MYSNLACKFSLKCMQLHACISDWDCKTIWRGPTDNEVHVLINVYFVQVVHDVVEVHEVCEILRVDAVIEVHTWAYQCILHASCGWIGCGTWGMRGSTSWGTPGRCGNWSTWGAWGLWFPLSSKPESSNWTQCAILTVALVHIAAYILHRAYWGVQSALRIVNCILSIGHCARLQMCCILHNFNLRCIL